MSTEIIADARTTLTAGVVGSLAGTGAVRLGDLVLRTAGVNQAASLGDDLISFIVHGISSSVMYNVAMRVAPESASNLYFTYVFFTTGSGITNSILRLTSRLIDGADSLLQSEESSDARSLAILDRQASPQSSCASC